MNREDILLLLVGALLAIIGGYLGDELRAWRERKRELKSIKIIFADELRAIESTIANMHEVWEKAKVLSPSYISELLSNTSAFDSLHLRLFLIKDEKLRKNIVEFYKRFKHILKKSQGKVGTLDESEDAIKEQQEFEKSFQALCSTAKEIRGTLEKKRRFT